MAMRSQGKGLGRGLSSLLGDEETSGGEASRGSAEAIAIDMIRPNPNQPRRRFGEDEIEELAASIRERGVIQPLILRPHPSGEGYEIVAGERRWRASQRAQLHEVPAVVRDFDDATVLEVAIIENVQRADLTAMEEARGYQRLMDEFGHTQAKLADVVGKSRSHVANTLRLLNLPSSVQDLLDAGSLTAGHARALMSAEDPYAVAREVIAKGLSVRATEALAKKGFGAGNAAEGPQKRKLKATAKDIDTQHLETDLSLRLGLDVKIDHDPNKVSGLVVIDYRDLDELDELCELLSQGIRSVRIPSGASGDEEDED